MVLSKREKSIAIGLGVVVVLVLLFEFVYSPLLDWQDSIDQSQAKVQQQQQQDQSLRVKHAKLQKVWKDMVAGGLQSDSSQAEAQLQQGLIDWSRESGVTLVTGRSDNQRTQDKHGFIPISYQVSGTGNSAQLTKLLWQIENTRIPVRIKSMQITSAKDGVDDLRISLSLSTLCVGPKKPGASNTNVVAANQPAQEQQ